MKTQNLNPVPAIPFLVTIHAGSNARQIARAILRETSSAIKLSPRVWILQRGCVGSELEARLNDTTTVANRLAAQLPAASVHVVSCDFFGHAVPASVAHGPNL